MLGFTEMDVAVSSLCSVGDMTCACRVNTEASAQSYGEEGEEGIDNGPAGAPLSERGSEELAARAQRLPSRRSSELGKRERRKRRMDDADEDDLNSLDEPIEGKKKRRGGVDCPRHKSKRPTLGSSWSRLARSCSDTTLWVGNDAASLQAVALHAQAAACPCCEAMRSADA